MMELVEQEVEQDQLLSLTLSMASSQQIGVKSTKNKITMKRKWSADATIPPPPPPRSSYSSSDEQVSDQNFNDHNKKILNLLQLRDQMFKLNQRQSNMVISEDVNQRLRLVHLLVASATTVDEHNFVSAIDNLINLYRHVSVTGDSAQRVAAYFADGLTSMLLTQSPFHDHTAAAMFTKLIDQPSSTGASRSSSSSDEFMGFTHLYRFSPCYQFVHFTANQAILEAFERGQEKNGSSSLHVIDFELSYGFQWPSLIQSLSEKAATGCTNENRVSLRITGFARSLEELVETEARLVSFSKGFENIDFEFLGLLRSGSNSNIMDLRCKKKKKNETVAVNLVFKLSSLSSLSKVSDTLKAIHSLDPSIVILVEKEGNKNINSSGSTKSIFLSTFMESLHYYAAMFDSLDICLPRDSPERLSIEKNYLAKEIKKEIVCGGNELLHHEDLMSTSLLKYEKMESWKGRMESNGFAGIEFSDRTNMQAKLLLRMRSHNCHHYHPQCEVTGDYDGFRVYERDDGRVISLGWQDRILVTVSAWHRV